MKTMQYIWCWLTDFYHFLGGVLMAVFGYLLPVRDLIAFVTLLFIFDVAFGYWKSRKLEKGKFQARIIWNKTMPRWLFSVIILILLFAWDKVHHQDFVKTYYVGGYFLSGTIIASIVENALKITGWSFFKGLGNIVKKNVETQTGEKIDGESPLTKNNEGYE